MPQPRRLFFLVFGKRKPCRLFAQILVIDGAVPHYVIITLASKIQWKPFWLAGQLYAKTDWTEWQ